MTPQEQELLSELFDRLAKSETNPRDLDAERTIADGLRRAPHAVFGDRGVVVVAGKQTSAEIETPLGDATMTLILSTAPKAGEGCAIIILRQR
jgi:hypothetical protein